MLSVPMAVKIFAATTSVDFRIGIDGLAAIVENSFKLPVMCGHLFFVFQ